MDANTTLILIGMGVMTLLIVMAQMLFMSWLRSDMKALQFRMDDWKEDFSKNLISFKEEIKNEMRDFHGRLCALEGRSQGEKREPERIDRRRSLRTLNKD